MSDLFAPLPRHCDVVVLGGGASGSSIAYQLAKRGADVLLLEAGDIGQGASGRNGGLTIGGARPQDHHGDFLLDSVGAATTLDIQRIVLDMAARVHPSLADTAVIRWWGGVMGFTDDWLPLLRRLDAHPNVVTACGFCPNGILCSPMTGHVIADVVVGEPPEVPLEPYGLSRFVAAR